MQPSERLNLFDGFVLDTARGCLVRSNQPVHLRPLAYEVLKYLVENRGRLISKDKLINDVWRGRAVTDGALGKCIEEIREALGPDSRQYLRNVRGRGYIFELPEEAQNFEITSLQAEQIDVLSVVVADESESLADTQVNGDLLNVPRASHDVTLRRRFDDAALAQIDVPATLRKSSYPRAVFLIVALLVVAAAAFGYFRYVKSRTQPITSIAVLPFVNATGDANKEYLSDGIGESIINRLSQLPSLRVMSRSSVYRYKGRDIDVQTTGAELGVQAVLTGRVVQQGDELSIHVELVNAADDTQIWGEQYNRKFTDVVSLQTDIARDVSRKLHAKLSPAEAERLETKQTANPVAYELYLKGRYYHFKYTRPEIIKGIGFLQQSIDTDPTYALAYAGLAEAYRSLAIAGWGVPSYEAYPQAKAAARQALDIDPNLAEARIALGWIAFSYDWDWAAAESEFKRAIELSPNSSEAHRGYAHLFSILQRHDEALAEIKRARELDPLSLLTNSLEGQFLLYSGRYDEATVRFQKVLEMDPTFWIARNGIARVYIARGRYDEAISELRKITTTAVTSNEPLTQLGFALAKSGKQNEAREIIEQLRSISKEFYVPAYSFAMIHNGLGENEEALKYLEKSVDEREVQITFVKIDKRWDDLRSDPRFQRLLQRVGFPK